MPAIIDPDRPEPLYRQLAAVLREQIANGRLRGRVPSVRTLQETYGVAQGTAERALTLLREEGVIVSVMGRGHFVAELRIRQGPAAGGGYFIQRADPGDPRRRRGPGAV